MRIIHVHMDVLFMTDVESGFFCNCVSGDVVFNTLTRTTVININAIKFKIES